MQQWQVFNLAELLLDVGAERVWATLTETVDTEQYLLGARVRVGEVGEAYRLERDDGWHVNGIVLIKEPPHRLRVTWRMETPSDLAMPNCEIEYLIHSKAIWEAGPRTKLIIKSYVDGDLPAPFTDAARTGWAMITRNLKAHLS